MVEKIACRLATEVDGVVDREVTGLRGMLPGGNRRSTTVNAEVGPRTTRLSMTLDVRYPEPVDDVVAHVRAHVSQGLECLAGVHPSQFDIAVRHLVLGDASRPRVQ